MSRIGNASFDERPRPSSLMSPALHRRHFLARAGAAGVGLAFAGATGRGAAQPSPSPIRIQTPDLAFADPLRQILASWATVSDTSSLVLSIVPAEPATDSLLRDARSASAQFAAAFVPVWSISDLVRDGFIAPVSPPPQPVWPALAQLRSFGGEWVASDLDHDCDLLYYRVDLLERYGLPVAQTWEELQEQATLLSELMTGGIALPRSHAQQVVDHFTSMSAAFVIPGSDPGHFWFDPDTMQPSIASTPHVHALDVWRDLARTTPDTLRTGSTAALWEAFIGGSVAYLIASADFLPYAIERRVESDAIGVAQLPGNRSAGDTVQHVGNTTGASWGGVLMRAAGEQALSEVQAFFDHLALPNTQATLTADRSSGITAPPADSSQLDRFSATGWPAQSTSAWIDAINHTLTNPMQLPPLRVAETRRYLQALEAHIVPFLQSDHGDAAETLAAAANDWQQINAAIGVDTQRSLYEQSLMPPPEHS